MIRCVFYLRLSREDGTGESNSIQNQRMLLQRYLEDREDMTYVGVGIRRILLSKK